MYEKPDWFYHARVFWDEEGRSHALPSWPPAGTTLMPLEIHKAPRRPRQVPKAPEPKAQQIKECPAPVAPEPRPDPVAQLPRQLILYYVQDPKSDERWVPMSPAVIDALTALAGEHGMGFDWREMPPPARGLVT